MMLSPESQLANLGFRLIPPDRYLKPYVRSYWYVQCDLPLDTYQVEYMNPSGGFGIIFNFGDELFLDSQKIAEQIFLDGVTTVSRKMGFLGRVEQIGVQFYEGGAYPFLGPPLIELQNKITFLDAIDRVPWLSLHARLQEAKTLKTRIGLLEEWLMRCLSLGKECDRLVPASLTMLRETAGRLPIPDLARNFFISQRQLERLYQSQVGMSPKQFARLVRIETARLSIKQMKEASTASLAAELGFYDQAHFIREFRSVIGITPHVYMKRNQK